MLLVLLGAFLHASWNAVVKSSRDKFLDIVLVTGGSALLSAFILPFLPMPAPGELALRGGVGGDPCRIFRSGRGGLSCRRHELRLSLDEGDGAASCDRRQRSPDRRISEPRRLERCSADLRRRHGNDPRPPVARPRRRAQRHCRLWPTPWSSPPTRCRWSRRAPVRPCRRLYDVGFPARRCRWSPGPGCGGGTIWPRISAPAGTSA